MKKFILESRNIKKETFLYNSIAAMSYSFQTMILLLVITRTEEIIDSSIFVMAYAVGNLLLSVGKFGIRNYQVTDVDEQYSMRDYIKARGFSVLLMVVGVVFYSIKGYFFDGYTFYKTLCVLLVCVVKIVDVIEDVYHGRLQQMGRLDVAAKILTIRLISYMILFSVLFLIFRDLLLVLVLSTIYYIAVAWFTNNIARKCFTTEKKRVVERPSNQEKGTGWKSLLVETVPLAITTTLMMYLGNGPKYVIDEQVTELIQTAYNIIFMPVFIISLLSSFVYNPMLAGLAVRWQEAEYGLFLKTINRQIGIICGITVAAIIAARIFGLTLMGIIYNIDLSQYHGMLALLLLSGGLLAFINLMAIVLTIWRRQRILMWMAILGSVMFLLLGGISFREYALLGLTICYALILLLVSIVLYMILLLKTKQLQQKIK